MSGLLRRIKRSRTADAGDPPAEQQAAGPEGATTTAETAPAGDEAKTSELPAATAPAIAVDPDRPAGLDERAAAVPAPSGRRGRLRRRLRYLRRARELMLRDLGGLVYEVHRTGSADFGAHSAVIAGKVERLSALDAESGAIEQALGAPRSEAVVFEPGVGGTCDVCGELYASAARFCSRCGTPTDPAAREAEAPAAEPRDVPPMPKAPGTAEAAVIAAAAAAGADARAKTDEESEAAAAADENEAAAAGEAKPATAADKEPATAEEAKPAAPAEEFTWTDVKPADKDEPAAAAAEEPQPAEEAKPAEEQPKRRTRRPKAVKPPEEPAAEAPEPADEPKDSEPRNPFGNIANGRPDDKGKPPELSDGDPLAARESRK
jgi:hypothetical protein